MLEYTVSIVDVLRGSGVSATQFIASPVLGSGSSSGDNLPHRKGLMLDINQMKNHI